MAVTIIGVYSVPASTDVSLVEVGVDRPPSQVDVGSFTQEDPNVDQSTWQVPYDERYLSLDGAREIGERWSTGWEPQPDVEEPSTTRVVFFMHFLDPNFALITPDGKVALPARQSPPQRLAFVDYEPPD